MGGITPCLYTDGCDLVEKENLMMKKGKKDTGKREGLRDERGWEAVASLTLVRSKENPSIVAGGRAEFMSRSAGRLMDLLSGRWEFGS